jgi:hypothetical protein
MNNQIFSSVYVRKLESERQDLFSRRFEGDFSLSKTGLLKLALLERNSHFEQSVNGGMPQCPQVTVSACLGHQIDEDVSFSETGSRTNLLCLSIIQTSGDNISENCENTLRKRIKSNFCP